MVYIQARKRTSVGENGEKKTTRWIKHYSSDHKILLVGEGDFSFAACLATSFGDASNMVATSLDSKEELRYKYPEAMANLEKLESLGCVVIHQVDAHTMSHHPLLQYKLFDRIVFNFPHATLLYKERHPLQIRDHRELMKGFFKSARDLMTRGGEVDVTHKTGYPYSLWKIQVLALDVGLHLVQAPSFSLSDYPGYFNKRGYGPHYGQTFHVGACRTFVFQTIPWRDDPAPSRACDYPTLSTSTISLYDYPTLSTSTISLYDYPTLPTSTISLYDYPTLSTSTISLYDYPTLSTSTISLYDYPTLPTSTISLYDYPTVPSQAHRACDHHNPYHSLFGQWHS